MPLTAKKKQLTRFAKPPLPDSRLLEPHHSHISGVLGANGTGKTTLLEFICLVTKAKDDLNSNYILIYESEGKLFYYSSEDSNKTLYRHLRFSTVMVPLIWSN